MATHSVRLISWNVKGRRELQDHVTFIRERSPDVVALQELNSNAEPEGLVKQMGLKHVKSTVEIAKRHRKRFRRFAVLIASRWPLPVLQQRWSSYVPWLERVLSVVVEAPFGDVELHTAYIPCGASHDWIKIQTFEGIFRRLARNTKRCRILCGDFNTPQEESSGGLVMTWGQYRKRNSDLAFHERWGKRWDAAERNILSGLARYNLADVYRSLNGYETVDWSWQDAKRNGVCRRFDHVFASPSMNPLTFKYLHAAVERGLSDHALAEVDFRPRV